MDHDQPPVDAWRALERPGAGMDARPVWTNDPDRIIASPRSQERATWAAHLGEYRGLAMSSDALPDLDRHGLELTRQLLRPSASDAQLWLPDAGPDGGPIERPGGTPLRVDR